MISCTVRYYKAFNYVVVYQYVCTVHISNQPSIHVRKLHAVVQDGDLSLSPSCNELRAIDTTGASYMNILSTKSPKPTQFMYSIHYFLLKLSTTVREIPSFHLITT